MGMVKTRKMHYRFQNFHSFPHPPSTCLALISNLCSDDSRIKIRATVDMMSCCNNDDPQMRLWNMACVSVIYIVFNSMSGPYVFVNCEKYFKIVWHKSETWLDLCHTYDYHQRSLSPRSRHCWSLVMEIYHVLLLIHVGNEVDSYLLLVQPYPGTGLG